MITHELKTDHKVFRAVADGLKTYEIRKNDRGFQVGDELWLKETLFTGEEIIGGSPLEYTGKCIAVSVKHVLEGPIYGLMSGWAIMSIELL